MINLTYAEAVRLMADLMPGFGKGQEYRDALAVLRRAEKVMAKVEGAELDNIKMDSMYADITSDNDWFCPSDDVREILDAALDYQQEMEGK